MSTRATMLHGETPPWEIGRPQPAFVALAGAGEFRGRLLDAGCGTGEHALLAAGLGAEVTGVDTDDRALRRARTKAGERGLTARFVHFDARRLAEFDAGPFDVVLDCGLFHALGSGDRERYVDGLRAVLRPGGRLFLLCYSTAQSDVPHRVSLDDILSAFADGWQVDTVVPTTIDTNVHPTGARGWLAGLTRTGRADRAGPAEATAPAGDAVHTGQARIATDRAARYLAQFCKHAAALTGDRHERGAHGGRSDVSVRAAEWDDTSGLVDFSPQGRATLTADSTTLTIRVDAADDAGLRAIQDVVTRDLQRMGARDRLSVTWQPGPAASAGPGPGGPADRH